MDAAGTKHLDCKEFAPPVPDGPDEDSTGPSAPWDALEHTSHPDPSELEPMDVDGAGEHIEKSKNTRSEPAD